MNPLTQLPGNVPIYEAIEELMARDEEFLFAYFDLSHFKPFNDYYGYARGDEIIRWLAELAVQHCSLSQDFVGHIGGDDFVVLFCSQDWEMRCQRSLQAFASGVTRFYD